MIGRQVNGASLPRTHAFARYHIAHGQDLLQLAVPDVQRSQVYSCYTPSTFSVFSHVYTCLLQAKTQDNRFLKQMCKYARINC